MKTLLTLCLLIWFMPSVATEKKPPPHHSNPTADATAEAVSLQAQKQLQLQGQHQGQSSNAEAYGGSGGIATANVEAGALQFTDESNTNVDINQGDTILNQKTDNKQRRQAPSVFSPSINPTAPCIVTGSAGVSAPGFGLGLGGGKQDKECTLRETARMFAEMGQVSFALQMLCASQAVERAGLEGVCPTDHVPEPPDPPILVTVENDCCKDGERLERCERQCKGGPKGPPPPPDEMLKDE